MDAGPLPMHEVLNSTKWAIEKVHGVLTDQALSLPNYVYCMEQSHIMPPSTASYSPTKVT